MFRMRNRHSTSASVGAAFSIAAGNSVSQGEGIDIDRVFAWNKFGVMEASYALGDPDQGDKFVVKLVTIIGSVRQSSKPSAAPRSVPRAKHHVEKMEYR